MGSDLLQLYFMTFLHCPAPRDPLYKYHSLLQKDYTIELGRQKPIFYETKIMGHHFTHFLKKKNNKKKKI